MAFASGATPRIRIAPDILFVAPMTRSAWVSICAPSANTISLQMKRVALCPRSMRTRPSKRIRA